MPAPNKLDVVQRVHNQNPGLIQKPHEFTNAVAYELWKENPSWGHNIKRGTQGLSEDAVCLLDNASPLKVTVQGSPNFGRGIYVVDIIGGSGGPNPTPAWIDQTQATLNGGTTADWSKPVPVDSHNPDPEPEPEPPPVQVECKFRPCNHEEVLVAIQAQNARIEELAAHFNTIAGKIVADLGELKARPTPKCKIPW